MGIDIAGFNALDMLLMVILLVGALVGLTRGMLPQLFSIISIWLGLIATLWLYKLFSIHILQGLGIPQVGSDTMAFLIIFVVFFNAFRLLIKYFSTPPEDRKLKKMSKEDPLAEAAKSNTQRFVIGPLNLIGGAVMGVILTGLWIAILLGVLQFIFQPTETPSQVGSFSMRISTSLGTSVLVPLFNSLLFLVATSVRFFVPKEADILNKVLGFIE